MCAVFHCTLSSFPTPLPDVSGAEAHRSREEDFHQDPAKAALCGFSAGGHVAACVGTMWNRQDLLAASGCTGEEGRPNALILGYPCITVDLEAQGDMYALLAGNRTLED